jgi:hypothetical protein
MRTVWMAAVVAVALCEVGAGAPSPAAPSWSPQVWLHAHNCYPDEGRGTDRLARALAAARGTVAIEQDLVWDRRRGQSVVSHDTELDGREPTLEDHFFGALTARLDHALDVRTTSTWPLIVLHLDFKTNEPEHHAAIWALLGRYERWLTTAPRVAADGAVQPLSVGPLLVLTEQGEGQERAFHDAVPIGSPLRLFGTVPAPRPAPGDDSPEARLAKAAVAPAEALIPSGATNYRRWTNHSWAVVEKGGPRRAGAWRPEENRRLEALVGRAHDLGLWIRFYTLNGHGRSDEGWSDGYNFGSPAAATLRWRAAIAAGVDFIATDQYEAFGEVRASAGA